jgi:hypothetical protein
MPISPAEERCAAPERKMRLRTRSTHYSVFAAGPQKLFVYDGNRVKPVIGDVAELCVQISSRAFYAEFLDVLKTVGTKATKERLHLRQIKALNFRLDHRRNISPIVVALDFALQER